MPRSLMPRSLAALLLLASVGCASGHALMPTPNLYVRSGGYPESQVAAGAQSSRVDLLYVTDRAPETVDGSLAYGARRSASVAYGSVTVEIGDELPWDELGQTGTVELGYLPGVRFSGPVTYVSPFLDKKTRTASVRLELRTPTAGSSPRCSAASSSRELPAPTPS